MTKLQNLSFVPRFCTYCNKLGHVVSNCRKRNTFHSNTQNVRHLSNQNQRPLNSKFCNYCKKPGHVLNECRKRQYNNNRNPINQNIKNLNQNHSQNRNFRDNQSPSQSTSNHHLNDQGSQQSVALPRDAHLIKVAYQS